MRDLDAGFVIAIEEESAEFVHLIELDFSSGVVRLSTGAHDIDWNGNTWEAVGGMLELGGIEESSDAKGQGMDMRISGVDQTILAVLLNNQYRGRPVTVYRAHLNRTTGAVISAHLRIKGLQLSPYTIEEEQGRGGGTVKISTRISGYFGVERIRGIQANLVSHQHHFAGDTFFQHSASLTNAKVYWGTSAPRFAKRREGTTGRIPTKYPGQGG